MSQHPVGASKWREHLGDYVKDFGTVGIGALTAFGFVLGLFSVALMAVGLQVPVTDLGIDLQGYVTVAAGTLLFPALLMTLAVVATGVLAAGLWILGQVDVWLRRPIRAADWELVIEDEDGDSDLTRRERARLWFVASRFWTTAVPYFLGALWIAAFMYLYAWVIRFTLGTTAGLSWPFVVIYVALFGAAIASHYADEQHGDRAARLERESRVAVLLGRKADVQPSDQAKSSPATPVFVAVWLAASFGLTCWSAYEWGDAVHDGRSVTNQGPIPLSVVIPASRGHIDLGTRSACVDRVGRDVMIANDGAVVLSDWDSFRLDTRCKRDNLRTLTGR